MQADRASSNSSGDEGQQAYNYEDQTKSSAGYRPELRDAPRRFQLNERVRMKVEAHVPNVGRVLTSRIFTIQSYQQHSLVGWTYQLFDLEAGAPYKGGDYFEEAKLKRETAAR